jgi:hypothetical protein
VAETIREGRRPERTVYAITEPGRTEFGDWLSELVSVPVKEYPQFEAALALMGTLPPDEALGLLRLRGNRLAGEVSGIESGLRRAIGSGLPRIFVIEVEYRLGQLRAELDFVEKLVADIADTTIDGYAFWQRIHETGETTSS